MHSSRSTLKIPETSRPSSSRVAWSNEPRLSSRESCRSSTRSSSRYSSRHSMRSVRDDTRPIKRSLNRLRVVTLIFLVLYLLSLVAIFYQQTIKRFIFQHLELGPVIDEDQVLNSRLEKLELLLNEYITVVEDRCVSYKLFKEPRTWHQAEAICKANNSALAKPRSLKQLGMLKMQCTHGRIGCWIGGRPVIISDELLYQAERVINQSSSWWSNLNLLTGFNTSCVITESWEALVDPFKETRYAMPRLAIFHCATALQFICETRHCFESIYKF